MAGFRPLLMVTCCALASCNASFLGYNRSEVQHVVPERINRPNPVPVTIIPINPEIVARANSAPYRKKTLPSYFERVANTPGLDNLPSTPDQLPRGLPTATVLPPDNTPAPYVIGVTDVVFIKPLPGPGNPGPFGAGPQVFDVRQDGTIMVPDIGAVPVAGLSYNQAQDRLGAALNERGFNPNTLIKVTEFKSQRLTISGAVRNPILASINEKPLYVDEALQLSGGVTTRDPAKTLIQIFRGDRRYQILYNKLLGGNGIQKVLLKGDDRLVVVDLQNIDTARAEFQQKIQLQELATNRERARLNEARGNYLQTLNIGGVDRDYAYVAGAVTVQGRYPLPFEGRAVVADALYFEGRGLEKYDGDPNHIYVIRGNETGNAVTAYWLDARNAANLMLTTRLELRPADIIFVSNQPITDWHKRMERLLSTTGVAQGSTMSRFFYYDAERVRQALP
jgi:polysaccharide export outer membrane protein